MLSRMADFSNNPAAGDEDAHDTSIEVSIAVDRPPRCWCLRRSVKNANRQVGLRTHERPLLRRIASPSHTRVQWP